jgi:protein-S-isoprenylcysteine O-methyltransferase Ste14
MSRLELKVPPDVVALVVGGLMWLVSTVTSSPAVSVAYRVLVAIVLSVVGIVLIVSARVAFAKADTTFSPIAPDRSSHLVTAGVYHVTRNPMYLGTQLVLLAIAALLSNPVAVVVALSYIAYMDRFQIRPEERVLRARFGSVYEDYTRSVRRWA